MTDAPWCERCDLPLAQCFHSLDKATVKAFDNGFREPIDGLVADGPTITASQSGQCPGCPNRIQPGDTITHTEHGWAHADEVLPKPGAQKRNDVDWSDT